MTIKKIFKSHIPSVSYYAKDGMQCVFLNGKHMTDIESHIAELTAESKSNPYIYVDESESEIDSEALSPLEVIKAEAYAQAKADIMRAMAARDNTSGSNSGNFAASLANTATIAQGGAMESSGDMGASVSVALTPAAISTTTATSDMSATLASLKTSVAATKK